MFFSGGIDFKIRDSGDFCWSSTYLTARRKSQIGKRLILNLPVIPGNNFIHGYTFRGFEIGSKSVSHCYKSNLSYLLKWDTQNF